MTHSATEIIRVNSFRRLRPRLVCVTVALMLAATAPAANAQSWQFVDVATEAGVSHSHGYFSTNESNNRAIAGGVATGDYDNDGWVDIYVVRGDIGPNLLFRNLGDGTFEEVGSAAGVGLSGTRGSGPFFTDLNGDGWLDLFIGGIEDTDPTLFLNRGDGTFVDATATSGIDITMNTFSATAGDYDRDGDLDLFLTHWRELISCGRLWRNNGDATFTCVDTEANVGDNSGDVREFSFTPNFADINNDRWPDILLASDFGRSQVFINNGDGTFSDVTSPVINDENGMGAAVADYDNDGDLDWFVSSIWDDEEPRPDQGWGITGNRLYRNLGDGSFEDATDEAGVRVGHWGWGSSFADFNNDGHLDLYHVNGWPYDKVEFQRDPAKLYIANGDGTFTERAAELGVNHLGQGRGIACFDYDRDGDLDIAVASPNQPFVLYRNDSDANAGNYLAVKVQGVDGNTESVGARVYATVGGMTQMRELRAGCNFVSQDPVEAHFGLADAAAVDMLRVEWPDGAAVAMENVAANQLLVVGYPQGSAVLAIKPGACPATMNLRPFEVGKQHGKKGGVLPVVLVGTSDFDVHDVDVASIRLEGIEPLRYAYEDVASPPVETGECACATEDADGHDDLTFKFQKSELVQAIEWASAGEVVELTLTGKHLDGTMFQAHDCVSVVGKGKPGQDEPIVIPPARAKLGPASPNPFNPVTRIRYTVYEEARVQIAVFNVKGERIATLVDRVVTAGEQSVEWDATRAPSGVYFYRLVAGDHEETRKMVLLK